MNSIMIERWNSIVTNKDLVINLGDVFFCGADKRRKIMRKLNGVKILVKGNHDSATDTHYRKIGFIEVYERLDIGNYVLTHRPIETDKINIHGHKHNKQLQSNNHYCVSVEQTEFKPILLKEVKNELL